MKVLRRLVIVVLVFGVLSTPVALALDPLEMLGLSMLLGKKPAKKATPQPQQRPLKSYTHQSTVNASGFDGRRSVTGRTIGATGYNGARSANGTTITAGGYNGKRRANSSIGSRTSSGYLPNK